jgi:hypothetical protein
MTDDETKRVADLIALVMTTAEASPSRTLDWTIPMADALARFVPMADAEALFMLATGLAIDVAPAILKTHVAIAMIEWLGKILGDAHLDGPKSAVETLEIVTRYLRRREGVMPRAVTPTGPVPAGSN